MKNIYLKPTNKASRLIYNEFTTNKYHLFNTPNDKYKSINIYVTSDEAIKYGDFCIDLETNEIFKTFNPDIECEGSRKIILTNDTDLIKDGVQEVSNEFLEWFVKNPSCEKVEVRIIKEPFNRTSDKYDFYQIIIPKEEPKHPKVFSENGNELFFDEQGNLIKEELKQEIIEESAEKIRQNSFMCCGLSKQIDYVTVGEREKVAFISGAEWQVRRNYSEKEVIDLLTFVNDRLPDLYSRFSPEDELKEWFEQNKKK